MTRRIMPMARPHGTGSITIRQTKKGDVYYGQWWVTPTQKASRRLGPVRAPGSKIGLTRPMAEAALRTLIVETKATPASSDGDGIRFADAGRVYRTHLKRQGRKKSTITAVESCLRVWAIPHFGTKPLNRVTFDDIEDLIAAMEQGRAGRRPLSPKSICNYIGTISALYTYGMRPRVAWVTSNPCDGIDLPAVEGFEEIRFLTLEEVDAVIRCVPATTPTSSRGTRTFPNPYAELDRVLYRTAALSGLREGELIALPTKGVDFPVSKIRVRHNYVLGEYDTPKSRRSSRAVPMALEVAQALAGWIPRDAQDDDLVFADPITGGPLDKAALLRRFRRALRAAGLPAEHRFHDLRHTFGTQCAASGVPMRTLQEWMGHADIKTTMRYADYAPSAHEAAMVDAAFARPVVAAEHSSERKQDDMTTTIAGYTITGGHPADVRFAHYDAAGTLLRALKREGVSYGVSAEPNPEETT